TPLPTDGEMPAIPGADAAFPIEHQGELLGALSVAVAPSDPLDPAKNRLVGDLAAQAGVVLRNVRLRTDLQSRLEDLQAPQKRLVPAQDEERRRNERNSHDGAQQHGVALTLKAGLARSPPQRHPGKGAQRHNHLEDDGRGFDPKAKALGTGLQGIADRLGALGGRFEVRSAPGAGTTVAGRISYEPIQ